MKIVLVVLAFFSFSNQYAQDYLPMLELDHIWNTKSIGCPDPCITSYSEHQIVGEIDFNGVIYQRLSNGSSSCYVREDNGRLYVYNTTLMLRFLYLTSLWKLVIYTPFPILIATSRVILFSPICLW